MKIGTLTNGISGVLVLSLEVNRLGKIVLIPIKKKNMGYSSLVRPALEVIFNIPIVIRPAKAMPSRTISDSIKLNHNMDILYPFSFD